MATPKLKVKLRNERKFLEEAKHSDSYYKLEIENTYVTLKLSDCERSITWYFGKPNNDRAVAKIETLKKLVDKMHAYLTQEVEK